MLFVYNCNPLATVPDQNRVLEGLPREDLFTVVYEQVMTDTARYADVVLPATTFLEHYDVAKGYGPISLQLVRPVIEPSAKRGRTRKCSRSWRAPGSRDGGGRDGDAAAHRLTAARVRGAELMETDRDATVRRRAGPVRRRISADDGPQGRPVPRGP